MGLGTDGSISNNSLSMWELMKFASLTQKNLLGNAAALPAPEVLRLATIDGAKLLKQDHLIGSLEVGKRADIITVDLWQPHLMPFIDDGDHDPLIWNLVYAARASDVRDVWVDGRPVIQGGRSVRVDEAQALADALAQTIDLLERRRTTGAVAMVK
jgi:5-methylthioadenosine/S-adenosylhomocysteine deaminase